MPGLLAETCGWRWPWCAPSGFAAVAGWLRKSSPGRRGGRRGRWWRDAVEGGVDDVADEPVVERRMTVQEAVVDRAVEEVERDLDLGLGGDLAAFDRAADDRACLVAARLDEPRAVLTGERGVCLGFGEQGGDHAPVGPAAGEPGPGAEQAEHVAA